MGARAREPPRCSGWIVADLASRTEQLTTRNGPARPR